MHSDDAEPGIAEVERVQSRESSGPADLPPSRSSCGEIAHEVIVIVSSIGSTAGLLMPDVTLAHHLPALISLYIAIPNRSVRWSKRQGTSIKAKR